MESKNGNEIKRETYQLQPWQRDQVMTWLRAGYPADHVPGLAKNQGWSISRQTVHEIYLPKLRKELADHADKKGLKNSWFNKEFRAEKAAEIADLLYHDIMERKMYAEEVTEREGKYGTETTTKPIYFAGMIKNFKDMVDTIGNETGQRKQTVDVNFNKNQNLNLSILVDKIYEEDSRVDKEVEGGEIIDLPPGDDFADDKGFLAVVDQQTPEELKELRTEEEEDDELLGA